MHVIKSVLQYLVIHYSLRDKPIAYNRKTADLITI
jgi:hypothetical protein